MFIEILEEKTAIELLELITEEVTFFIESNPNLFTRFAWFTFCLIALIVILSQLIPVLTEISSQKQIEKEIFTQIDDESENFNDSCLVLAKILLLRMFLNFKLSI